MKFLLTYFMAFWSLFSIGQSNITYLKMERTPCFGKCPSYTIEIKSNGNCKYIGLQNAVFDGQIVGKISKKTWNKLIKKYTKYSFLKLPLSYKTLASDLSKANLTMKVNGKTKVIKNALEGPEFLNQLCLEIEQLISKGINWDKNSFKQNKSNYKYDNLIEDESNNTQTIEAVENIDENKIYTFAEHMPEFIGGYNAMTKYINSNIEYPQMAKEVGVRGKVICAFVVEKNGEISNVKVMRGIGYGCDEEAVRVLKNMPNWKPGFQNGKPIRVNFNIPIAFQLK